MPKFAIKFFEKYKLIRFTQLNNVIELVEKLQNCDQIDTHEASLRILEARLIHENFDLIVDTARTIGEQLVIDSAIASPESIEEACIQRYLCIPILYKLGYTKEAAEWGQVTFERLFPQLHQTILDKIHELFSDSLIKLKDEILKKFTIDDENILRVYARVKSTNSIWKKVESTQKLRSMSLVEFSKSIDDFIAIRWNMRLNQNENRYDALLNAISLVPKDHVIAFRNQQVPQDSGFSSEPVMKFYYVISGIPVELQLLGGFIEHYLCAKGYASYKIGYNFNPKNLNDSEKNARLGLCIYCGENGLDSDFRKTMLMELVNGVTSYDKKHIFILNDAPNNPANVSLRFSECEPPIYLLDKYAFDGHPISVTNTSNTLALLK